MDKFSLMTFLIIFFYSSEISILSIISSEKAIIISLIIFEFFKSLVKEDLKIVYLFSKNPNFL